jgi:RecA-family ATPase
VQDGPAVVALADVAPAAVRWLWRGRVPLGKLTVLDGDPGVGKSTLLLDLAARVSRGTALPDCERSDLEGPATVVLLTSEDGLADTVRPRLAAAGADLGRVVAMTGVRDGQEVVLPREWPEVARVVARARARLLVVDPLMAYLERGVNAYRDQDARRALAPLALLADKVGVAIVVVRHLTKSGGANALYRGGGSIGIIGTARSGLLAAADPEDPAGERRVLAVTKGNLAGTVPALGYRLARIIHRGT